MSFRRTKYTELSHVTSLNTRFFFTSISRIMGCGTNVSARAGRSPKTAEMSRKTASHGQR